MKILLVEDEPVVANLIRKTLEEEHYEVTIAPDQLSGWNHIARFPYDAAVVDVCFRA